MRIFFVILLIFLAGCSVKKPFPEEDKYLLKAVVYENDRDYKDAAKLYKFLYQKTQEDIYFKKYVQMLFFNREFKAVLVQAQNFLDKKFDKEIFQYRIFSFIKLGMLDNAKEELLTRFNKKDEFFYSAMRYIFLKKGKYKEALIYSKSLYALNPTKANLLNLVDDLIQMRKYNEALAYLQTHIRLKKCDYKICLKLARIYKELYDIDNLAYTYEKLGKFDKKYYVMALNLYVDEQRYKDSLKLIKRYHLSNQYLMYVYESMGDYKKAALIALNLYLKTKDIKYFIKYTFYLYKIAPNDKENIKEVVKNLEEIVKKANSPIIYNSLGYLLIKYDLDYEKGIEYVKKALELSPNDVEIMDSLAWGYYKLHQCRKAWDIIKNINTYDNTILEHKKFIKRCVNDFRKDNKSNKKRFGKKKK